MPAGVTTASIKVKPEPGTSGTAKMNVKVVPGQGYTVGSPAKGKVMIVD